MPSKLDTKNIFSISKMMSVTKTQRQENKKRKLYNIGNYNTYHEPLFEKWVEGDPEFSIEYISNPSIQKLFIGEAFQQMDYTPRNKSRILQIKRLEWITSFTCHRVGWIVCTHNIFG